MTSTYANLYRINTQDRKVLFQWGSEYQTFEYQKHLNTKLQKVQISKGLVFKWSVYGLCTMSYSDHLNTRAVSKKTRWQPCIQMVTVSIHNPCTLDY